MGYKEICKTHSLHILLHKLCIGLVRTDMYIYFRRLKQATRL